MILKSVLVWFFGMVIIYGVIFGVSFGGYEMYKFFNPRNEEVRYDTFKNSQAYNEGMTRHLYEIERQYNAGSDEDKASLRQMIIHEFEVYDINRLPNDLQSFYNSLNPNGVK